MKKNCFYEGWRRMAASAAELKNVHALALAAMMGAINVVLDFLNVRITITQDLRITFGFLTMAFMGMLCGPVVAMLGGAASDILGWLVNNGGGAYFPGFTITAVLGGLIWGMFLYKRPLAWWRFLLSKLTINLFLNIGLNSVWLYIYYGKVFSIAALPARIFKNIIMLPIEVVLLVLFGKIVERCYKAVVKR